VKAHACCSQNSDSCGGHGIDIPASLLTASSLELLEIGILFLVVLVLYLQTYDGRLNLTFPSIASLLILP
jgi:hypothetical protein